MSGLMRWTARTLVPTTGASWSPPQPYVLAVATSPLVPPTGRAAGACGSAGASHAGPVPFPSIRAAAAVLLSQGGAGPPVKVAAQTRMATVSRDGACCSRGPWLRSPARPFAQVEPCSYGIIQRAVQSNPREGTYAFLDYSSIASRLDYRVSRLPLWHPAYGPRCTFFGPGHADGGMDSGVRPSPRC